jgi:glycosyltransferase 2 family protein
MPGFLSRGSVRVVLGLLISAVFIFVTLSRVDLALVGQALGRVQPAGLVVAVGLVAIETALRALRWHLLLQPVRPTKYRSAVAYLCIGYLANAILPARLGDLTRAYLAGGAFGIARIGVLGTILVERLSDGLFILAAVAVLGVVVAGGGSLATTAAALGAIALGGAVGLAMLFFAARRVGIHETRLGRIASDLLARLAIGAVALRRPGTLAAVIGLTVLPFAVGVVIFGVVARAVGVDLTVAQVALAFGAVSLSFAIPAAPGSVGTYEFVGVTVLTAYGVTAEVALATVLLVHLIVTISTSIAGLVAAWMLHFRVGTITRTAAAAGSGAPVEADVP